MNTLERRRWYVRWWTTAFLLCTIALMLVGVECSFEHYERLEGNRAQERQQREAP